MSKSRGISDTARRTWDEAAYQSRANNRDQIDDSSNLPRKVPVASSERVFAERRRPQELLDADSLAGSSVVVPDGASKAEAGGFYCRHCDVLLHDSSAYLNHVNGRAHNAIVGVALSVKRSTAEEVRIAFEEAYRRKLARNVDNPPKSLAERLENRRAEGVKRRNLSKSARGVTSAKAEVLPGADGTEDGERIDEAVPRTERDFATEVVDQKQMRDLGLPTSF